MPSDFLKRLKKLMEHSKPGEWSLEPSILLCPNTPKPMHGLVPRVILGQSWWNKTRKAAYKSTNFHCKACGVAKTKAKGRPWLEGHELYEPNYAEGTWTYLRTVPLCHYCHNYIHNGRLEALLQKGMIQQQKYVSILTHGDAVLSQHGLRKPAPYNGPFAEWENWRLIIDGQEYRSLYGSFYEWAAAHGNNPGDY